MAYNEEIRHVINAANSTSAELAAGGTFTGAWVDVTDYTTVAVAIAGDNPTSGTLYIQASQDGGTNYIQKDFAIGDTTFDIPKIWNVVESHIRIVYVNGGTSQVGNGFRLQTKLSNGQQMDLVNDMGDIITDQTTGATVKAVLTGKNKAGNYVNTPVDSEGHPFVHIHDPTSAFGQVKVAEEEIQIAIQFPYNINTKLVSITTANGGTATVADSMMVLSTSAASNGTAVAETKNRMKYQAGTGGISRFTGLFTAGVANSTQMIGYGDDTDGFFIGYNGAAFGIMRRQNGVDTWIPQTSFNVDKFDGTGGTTNPTGVTLDPTQGNVFQIKFQWLGFGAITFYVEDANTGEFEPMHIIQYANANSVPSVYNPTLPLRWEVTNSGNTSDIILKSASAMAAIEGKRTFEGAAQASTKVTGSTAVHAFTIRNKTTYAGKTNRTPLIAEIFSYANDGTSSTTYTLEKNASITSPSWSDISTNTSITEVTTAGTIGTPGDEVISFAAAKSTGDTKDIFARRIVLQPGESLTVRASNTNSSNLSLTWLEDF